MLLLGPSPIIESAIWSLYGTWCFEGHHILTASLRKCLIRRPASLIKHIGIGLIFDSSSIYRSLKIISLGTFMPWTLRLWIDRKPVEFLLGLLQVVEHAWIMINIQVVLFGSSLRRIYLLLKPIILRIRYCNGFFIFNFVDSHWTFSRRRLTHLLIFSKGCAFWGWSWFRLEEAPCCVTWRLHFCEGWVFLLNCTSIILYEISK